MGLSHAQYYVDCLDASSLGDRCARTDFILSGVYNTTRSDGWYVSDSYVQFVSGGKLRNYDKNGEALGTCEAVYGDTVEIYTSSTPPDVASPTDTNGVLDPNEDGVDCGGDTGVDCVSRCPDGYVLSNDGTACLKSAPSITVDGVLYDDMVYPWQTADPILASPDVTISQDSWSEVSTLSSPTAPVYNQQVDDTGDQVTNYTNGDYVVRDSDGNIVSVKITGDPVEVDNGDGTTTTTTTVNSYNSETGQAESSTESVTRDSSGNVVSQSTTSSGTSGTSSGKTKLVGVGLGSSSGVTGDQYARGVDQLSGQLSEIAGEDEETEEGGDSQLGFTGTADMEEVPEKDFNTLYDGVESLNPFPGLSGAMQITLTSPACTVSADFEFLGSHVFQYSICEYQSYFNTTGYVLLFLTSCGCYLIVMRR